MNRLQHSERASKRALEILDRFIPGEVPSSTRRYGGGVGGGYCDCGDGDGGEGGGGDGGGCGGLAYVG